MHKNMRLYHRYLGFFLAGIMAVYAISGVVLIFRNTDFLKTDKKIEKELPQNTKVKELGQALRIKNFKVERVEGDIVYFDQGFYNVKTGVATYSKKELPYIMNKLTHLHKATTDRPLFFLNIFFGLALLFFVVSSFWMFLPKTTVFKKGIYFTIAGSLLTLLLIFI